MAHAAQVAFTFFAHVADEQKRQRMADALRACNAAAMASIAVIPAPLSETPGPYKRLPCWRTFSGVPAGNTVSR